MLYFIRHGETYWNAAGRLQGQLDTELNPHGREQARQAGRILAAVAPQLAEAEVVSSPLKRACESLEILMSELVRLGTLEDPTPFTTDDRLKELSFGRWEGLTWKEVRRNDPAGYAARNADIWNFAPPAGESYADLVLRAGPLLRSLPKGAVVVSHGGISRIALHLLGGASAEEASGAPIRQGDVLLIDDGRACWASGALVGAEAG
jgi:broad specificity phosphatase PhoE